MCILMMIGVLLTISQLHGLQSTVHGLHNAFNWSTRHPSQNNMFIISHSKCTPSISDTFVVDVVDWRNTTVTMQTWRSLKLIWFKNLTKSLFTISKGIYHQYNNSYNVSHPHHQPVLIWKCVFIVLRFYI